MKKIILSVLVMFCAISSVNAEESFLENDIQNPLLKAGIRNYKEANYTKCIQKMNEVLQEDPSSALANYYMAISLVRAGDTNNAKKHYQNVVDLSTSSQLTSYAKIGIKCIDEPNKCPSSSQKAINDVVSEIQMVPSNVKSFIEQRRLENIKDQINSGINVKKEDIQKLDNSIEENQSAIPTNEEVSKALEVLKKAGINPYANQQMTAQSPEMMLMASMNGMNGSSGMNTQGNMMNMLPYLIQQKQNGNSSGMDPQMVKTMMMNSMMPNMYSGFSNQDKR